MKLLEVVALFLAILKCSSAFMSVQDFRNGVLDDCYSYKVSSLSREVVNGQELPLPNSIETFISLVEKYEAKNPRIPNIDLIRKFLTSFRIDDLESDLNSNELREAYSATLNSFHKAFFGINDPVTYAFLEDDLTPDEKCALHFMLSHTVNSTRREGDEASSFDERSTKQPRETGVVSIHAKWKQAFSLGRVLMGLMAGLSGNNILNAYDIAQKVKGGGSDLSKLREVKVNRIYAVTLADLVTVTMPVKENPPKFLPNGIWNDATCTTEYKLLDNNNAYISNSLLRGAIDGLILGRKAEEKAEMYRKLRVSQILRMYYGYTGLIDDPERTSWCTRQKVFDNMGQIGEEVLNFNNLYKVTTGSLPGINANQRISEVLNAMRSSVFDETDNEAADECSVSETSQERRCATPSDIFAILDYSTTDMNKNFQQEVIGNLSVSFDMRPYGNLMGVYTNLKPTAQQNALDTITNQTGISGCPSCYARYYNKRGTKEDEAEILRDLNQTLTDYLEASEEAEEALGEPKAGTPAKVILYFNYGSPVLDQRLNDALWELEKYFAEATIVAVGPRQESLRIFTYDDDKDVFSETNNALMLSRKLKQRICKVPAEFTFKQCYQSTRGAEADNKQEAYVPNNKIQYWVMYPKYFLKSYGVKLIFKAEDGAAIRVCFSRYYDKITEDRGNLECKDSSGGQIEFYDKNPCYRRTERTCQPFYFSVEGKKEPNGYCESIRCTTPKDIQFEFSHEGISCNMASLMSTSFLALLLACFMFFLQRH